MRIVNKIIDFIEDYLLLIIMFVLPIIICIQVVTRAAGGSLKWQEETARYLFIWLIYIGAARSSRIHTELKIDAIRTIFKDGTRAQAIYDTIGCLLSIVFSVCFMVATFLLCKNAIEHPQFSVACKYPMVCVHMCALISSIFLTIRYVQYFVQDIKRIIHPYPDNQVTGGEA